MARPADQNPGRKNTRNAHRSRHATRNRPQHPARPNRRTPPPDQSSQQPPRLRPQQPAHPATTPTTRPPQQHRRDDRAHHIHRQRHPIQRRNVSNRHTSTPAKPVDVTKVSRNPMQHPSQTEPPQRRARQSHQQRPHHATRSDPTGRPHAPQSPFNTRRFGCGGHCPGCRNTTSGTTSSGSGAGTSRASSTRSRANSAAVTPPAGRTRDTRRGRDTRPPSARAAVNASARNPSERDNPMPSNTTSRAAASSAVNRVVHTHSRRSASANGGRPRFTTPMIRVYRKAIRAGKKCHAKDATALLGSGRPSSRPESGRIGRARPGGRRAGRDTPMHLRPGAAALACARAAAGIPRPPAPGGWDEFSPYAIPTRAHAGACARVSLRLARVKGMMHDNFPYHALRSDDSAVG